MQPLSKTTVKQNRFQNMFLFHCCHVSFHHPLLLRSNARLSKIIPAVQIPRNLVCDRDPSAVYQRLCPQMSLAVLQCAPQYFLSLEALKVTFFVPSRQQLSAVAVLLCKQLSKLQKNTRDRGENYSHSCAMLMLCLYVQCAITCMLSVTDLQCIVVLPYNKSADWPDCSTSGMV